MKRSGMVSGLLAAVLAFSLVAAGGAVVDAGSPAEQEQEQEEVPMGAEVSSFMQASTAETQSEVEDGMFIAALSRADNPEERRALIQRRQERLEERHQRLEEQRSAIPNGEQTTRTLALAARVSVGAASLERSILGTQRAAEEAGVDTTRLDRLRTNASELRESRITRLARVLADPAEEVPGTNRSGNRSVGPPAENGSEDPSGENRSEDGPADPPAIDAPVTEEPPTPTPDLVGNGSDENGSDENGSGDGQAADPPGGSDRLFYRAV